jgi:hypothetical protein
VSAGRDKKMGDYAEGSEESDEEEEMLRREQVAPDY